MESRVRARRYRSLDVGRKSGESRQVSIPLAHRSTRRHFESSSLTRSLRRGGRSAERERQVDLVREKHVDSRRTLNRRTTGFPRYQKSRARGRTRTDVTDQRASACDLFGSMQQCTSHRVTIGENGNRLTRESEPPGHSSSRNGKWLDGATPANW